MAESDEETFVVVGNPLTPYEEDEVPKKPVPVQDQKVLDSKGRQRFHGAFTGGFSAGYFNSVGTEEGWTPSTFVSSRNKKAEASSSQRPEQFMDEEDFAEYGIAPKKVSATDDFSSLAREKKRKAGAASETGIIPGDILLQDLVVPASVTAGVRLLRKLGWKEGQGIGPRVKKKVKRKKQKPDSEKKVYGCAMPASSDSNPEESSEEDIYAEGLSFAPKDVNPVSFDPKDNLHGIGYSGINPKSALGGHFNLFEPVAAGSSGKKGIRGQAFGIGALEDEDEDIYALDHMSNYDKVLTGPEKNATHGWTAPKHRGSDQLAIGYLNQVLEGFKMASKSLKPKKRYPPPQIPRDFRPRKAFRKPPQVQEVTTAAAAVQPTKPPERKKLDANTRGALLGEESLIKSVFDLVSVQDRSKLQSVTEPASEPQQPSPAPPVSSSSDPPKAPLLLGSRPAISFQIGSSQGGKQGLAASQGRGSGFKPFASDPAKQERYERYQERMKHGGKDLPVEGGSQLTEWERERENEEFARAAQLYRPLSSMMASRFTTAKFSDATDTAELPAEEKGDVNDQTKAAEMKMYGRLTRDVQEWHPDNVLCKRFNIPNPYPDSNVIGLLTVKRDKFSVFNFLNDPTQTEQQSRKKEEKDREVAAAEAASKKSDEKMTTLKSVAAGRSSKKSGFKPLAILGEVDLSVKKPSKWSSDAQEAEPEAREPSTSQSTDASDTLPQTAKDEDAEEKEERPSMDIFKAIFEDSDSEASSSEEEEEKTPKEESMERPVEKAQGQTEVIETDNQMDTTETEAAAGLVANGATGQTTSTSTFQAESLEDRLAAPPESTSSVEDNAAAYGPALPPPVSAQGSSQAEVLSPGDRKSKDKHKRKKNKKKSKHKKHKAKSKHSKEKKKKKKKKQKKMTWVVAQDGTSSSGSEADSESSSNSDGDVGPSDADLLNKLKSLPADRRPKASDFW